VSESEYVHTPDGLQRLFPGFLHFGDGIAPLGLDARENLLGGRKPILCRLQLFV